MVADDEPAKIMGFGNSDSGGSFSEPRAHQ
jgi:hypothetical protein